MTKYLDCTIQNGVLSGESGAGSATETGAGSPSDPYIAFITVLGGTVAAGEILYVKTTEAEPWEPYAGNHQDTSGIIVRPWGQFDSNFNIVIHADASNLIGTFVWRLENAGSEAHFFEFWGVPVAKYAFRLNANTDGFRDNIVRDSAGYLCLTGTGVTGVVNAYRNKSIRCGQGWRIDSITGTLNLHQCADIDSTASYGSRVSTGTAVGC